MKFKEFLQNKGISDETFATKSASEMASLHNEFTAELIKSIEDKTATKEELNSLKTELDNSTQVKELIAKIEATEQSVKSLEENGSTPKTVKEEISKFLNENKDVISNLHKAKHGMIELTIDKAVGTMTTGSASLPSPAPALQGTQVAPPTVIDLRGAIVESLVTTIPTNQASYAYSETLPKDGDYSFLAEAEIKPQIDFEIQTRYASPVKIAAWIKLTDEAVTDIPQMEAIANDLLRKKHALKKQSGILFGDGVAPNPKGATVVGRTFVAGAMAGTVSTPNFMDVVNACITDIYTTHNYVDETPFMANIVMINPVDFFTQIVSAKDANGLSLYPSASLFNRVVMGGALVIPESSIPAGKIFVSDMSRYNTTNYVPYNVQIGWVNDDFIKNQFVILAESRFHAFVKRLDEQAFIYDDISTVETALATA